MLFYCGSRVLLGNKISVPQALGAASLDDVLDQSLLGVPRDARRLSSHEHVGHYRRIGALATRLALTHLGILGEVLDRVHASLGVLLELLGPLAGLLDQPEVLCPLHEVILLLDELEMQNCGFKPIVLKKLLLLKNAPSD